MTDENLELDERVNESSTSAPNDSVQQSEPTDIFKDCPQLTALPNIRQRSAFQRNHHDELKEETRCLCHEEVKQPSDRKARNRLIAACIIVFVFMIGEISGKEL